MVVGGGPVVGQRVHIAGWEEKGISAGTYPPEHSLHKSGVFALPGDRYAVCGTGKPELLKERTS